MKIISPTGLGIRNDKWGSGKFRARRGKKLHKGLDFECEPGQPVFSPITGKVIRRAAPYRGGSYYDGILLTNRFAAFKMFYFKPIRELCRFGTTIKQGQRIGHAQDISRKALPKKYPDMKPHIHLEVEIHGDLLLPKGERYIDPEVLM